MRKIRKILLMAPSAQTFKDHMDINPMPPIGLAYIGAVLERNQYEVKIRDCLMTGWGRREDAGENIITVGMSCGEIEDEIRKYGPDVLGVSNMFSKQRKHAHEIYAIAKRVDPAIITIAGGAHPTAMPDLVMEDVNLDYIVLGEGEESILHLLRAIESGRGFNELDGVCYRENGKAVMRPQTMHIQDLDGIPFPARHLIDMEDYFGLEASHGIRKYRRFSPIVTSRGCPARCVFCSAHKVWGRRYRARSAENVVAELVHLKEKYGVEEVIFEDDNFTLDARRAEKILDKMIEMKLDIKWATPNGVGAWTLTKELIDKMKESGCYSLSFPVESGNQDVLKNIIKKPLDLARVEPLIKHAQSIGLDVCVFIVIGMPGEKEGQMWDSFRFARKLKVYKPHISVATPYPGTELYELCKSRNYIRKDFTLDDLYIKSFPIATEDWDAAKLKEILSKGERYLMAAYLADKPFSFFATYVPRLVRKPGYYFKRALQLGLNR